MTSSSDWHSLEEFLNRAKHSKELKLDGEPMLFCGQSLWKCPEPNCETKIGIDELH